MNKRPIQNHHIVYENERHKQKEIVVPVFKGEHLILTKLQWYCRKKISKGFLKSLKVFIALNEDKGVDIDGKKEK